MKSWRRNYTPQTFAAAKPPAPPEKDGAYAQGEQFQISDVDLSVRSLERALYGALSTMAPRVNLDQLVSKQGLRIYRQMRADEQVKAVCVFKRDAILSRGWTFEFDKETKLPEAEREKRIRVCEKIIEKMPGSFIDALNVISTGREFGFSMTEKVYQIIEVDGKSYVGIQSLRGREPWSFEFYVDPYGDLIKCEQLAGGQRIPIQLDKFIHYVHNPEFDCYFGQSDLREAYRSWYFKEQTMKFWGFYMEKLGGGLFIGKITPNANIAQNSAEYRALTSMLQSIKATGSILLPAGVEAEAVFPTNSDSFDKAISFHDLAIAKALLVPNLLGVSNNGGVGSYAQSQTQLDAFAWTVKADTERLESCLNEQLFKDLGEQNWGDGEYPCLKFKPPDTEKLKWIMETWQKFLSANAVLPTIDDEKRIREILGMPPRNDDTEILTNPAAEQEHELGEQAKDNDHKRSEEAKDKDKDRNFEDDKRRATDPVLTAAQEKAKKKAEFAAMLQEFGFNPDQERDESGRWSNGQGTQGPAPSDKAIGRAQSIVEKVYEDGRYNKVFKPKSPEQETELRDKWRETRAAVSHSLKDEGFKIVYRNGSPENGKTTYRDEYGNEVVVSTRSRLVEQNPNSTSRLNNMSEFILDISYTPKHKMTAPDPRDARISIASARERVDFAVIDRNQNLYGERLSSDWSKIVVSGVNMLLGDEEALKKLTDNDPSDIGMIEFSGVTKGRLKKAGAMALRESWALGRRMAESEIRKTGHRRKSKDMAHFANLRETAEEYFENNSFRMASNVSDGVRSLIQQELQNSVKYGKSPQQTRETIWDRLTRKGFAAREDVKEVETDEGVIRALDALWVDDEGEAKHYLDTLARTNLFEAMNEARFGEFQDPALDGFVVALRYSAILDDRTTHICRDLDDHVFKTGNPVWNEMRPPNHYNCRSLLVPITQVDIQQGVWDGEESEVPNVEVQDGFK
jgi:SPP1 gp7 family putative phage head morphogenesis protein